MFAINHFKSRISNFKFQISNPESSLPGASLARRANGGFTLVELLVVITIIGILAGLIAVAAVNAVYGAKQMRIKAEVDQLDMALKAFKQQYGDYPPCDLRVSPSIPNPRLKAFIAKAFPRYNQANLRNDLTVAGVDPDKFDPARALVFWLSGFNPDVTHPFTSSSDTSQPYTRTRTPLYDFDKTRLIVAESTGVVASGIQPGGMWYLPSGGNNAPFVYFDYRNYGTGGTGTVDPPSSPIMFAAPSGTDFGTAMPYVLRSSPDPATNPAQPQITDTWANLDTFQIISAGQDGKFTDLSTNSTPRVFPKGFNYDTTDNDNVTNFADKSSLEDAKP